jgi:antitoxin (DNA-binding transcriptional repressor) of toxin-antitoxin stability system
MKATLEEVENGAAEFLHCAIDGETVVVYRGDRPVAEIHPLGETETLRPVGLAAGEFEVPDDFDDPLPDKLLDAFGVDEATPR